MRRLLCTYITLVVSISHIHRSYIVLLLAWLLLCPPTSSNAQQPFWQQTTLLGGAWAASATAPNGDIYAAALNYLFRSTDDGKTWLLLDRVGEWIIGCIAFDGAGNIFVGSGYGEIYRSSDDGTSWVQIIIGPSSGGYTARSIAIDSKGTIYVGMSGEGILRSTDQGDTWTDLNLKLSDGNIYKIVVDDDDHVIAAVGTFIFRSTDHGNSWQRINGNGLPSILLLDLVLAPDGTLYAGSYGGASLTSSGVFRSTDNGLTWAPVNNGLSFLWVERMAVDASGGILAAADSVHGGPAGLFRSTNRGDSWQRIDPGFTARRPLSIGAGKKGEIFYATDDSTFTSDGGSFRRSDDNGTTWQRINLGTTTPDIYSLAIGGKGRIYAGLRNESVSVSSDRGTSWSPTRVTGERHVEELLAVDGAITLAATDGAGLRRSTDGGMTWQNVIGGSDTSFFSLGRDALGRLYAGSDTLWRSSDDGATWTYLRKDFYRHSAIATAPNGRMFLGIDDIYISTDNGDTWARKSDGVPVRWAIASFTFLSDGTIFAGARDDRGRVLFRSTDNGEHWVWMEGLAQRALNQLLTDSRDRIYAATDSGVFRSTDRGLTWHSLNSGLKGFLRVKALALDPGEGLLYAGTERGVFRSVISTPADVSHMPARQALPDIVDCYPNPFSTTATFRYTLAHTGHVRLVLHDLLGRQVAVLVDGEQEAGEHRIPFSTAGHGCGPMYYVLDVEGSGVGARGMIMSR